MNNFIKKIFISSYDSPIKRIDALYDRMYGEIFYLSSGPEINSLVNEKTWIINLPGFKYHSISVIEYNRDYFLMVQNNRNKVYKKYGVIIDIFLANQILLTIDHNLPRLTHLFLERIDSYIGDIIDTEVSRADRDYYKGII